ncbi:putative nepenthesin [Rosa chinensis]|uniref:Putative nepenthesin n=1 Tax=Rosa chinensis TaxID=74649 RepID=A0A2P6RD03_ROSCH|nr:putative nepenthesin [Rosa chinensis]
MKFSMGTSPSDIYLTADTGSTLVWMQCKPCKRCYNTKYAMFDPRKSSTYRNITCYARKCGLVDDQKPPGQSPEFCKKFATRRCTYRVEYGDTSSSEGVLAKETIALTFRTGKVITLKDSHWVWAFEP